jgi:uncharacterized protein
MSSIKIAVVTGGHPFDVQPFHQLFASLNGIEAYIQHTDEFASEPDEVRDGYDAVVAYSMFRDTPQDNLLWYTGKPKSAFERLWERGQGIILLHHAVLAYRDWPEWDDLAGMKQRVMRSYHPNEQVRVEIRDPGHAIARDLSAWEMFDETYLLDNAALPDGIPGNHIFLSTDHPNSMKPLGWTRQYRQSKVFCFVSGHGAVTYENPGFRKTLANGIRWVVKE